MSQVTDNQRDFIGPAGRQLLLLAAGAVAAVTLLMLGLAWASSVTGAGAGISRGIDPRTGTVSVVLRQEPPNLNSIVSTDQVSSMVLGHLVEGLLTYDEHNEIAPGVAERWEVTDSDATFWLRDDALWSDGEPVTAHDFVFAWRMVVDPANASEYANVLYPIVNGEAINRGELPPEALGVEALDDRTLHVRLARPVAYFDKLTAFKTYLPVREDFYEATRGRYGAGHQRLLYNGPFVMTRWVHGAHIRMEKNPLYWNADRVHINVLNFPYITEDPSAKLNLFKDGSIAFTELTEENLNEALVQGWHLQRFMDGTVFYVEFNHREGRITRNRNFRKAVQHALDPKELVYRVIKLPGYLPGESLFPVWLQGVEKPLRQENPARWPAPDPALARRYLEQARQELGLTRFPPLVLLSGDTPVASRQAEYYQETLRRVLGLEIRIDTQIFKQRLAKMAAGEFDLVLAGWAPDYDDPMTFGDLFGSWNLNNRGRYDNPELDRWIRVAEDSTDPRVRVDAFGRIQRILEEEAVILPNYERGVVYVVDPRLEGMVRRSVGVDPDFSYARIREG